MKRTTLSGMCVCVLAGAVMFGCADAEVGSSDAVADVERLAAGEQVAGHGIKSYQIDRADDATSILLEGVDGKILGELLVYNPRGTVHMELSWENHKDAFELDLGEGQSPFTIITNDGVATVTMGQRGAPEGDQASLEIYDKVKPRWDVAAKIFRDLRIDGRRSEVATSRSFTTSKKSGEASATWPACLSFCNWCDGSKNCNFLGASRKYEGCVEGNLCHSTFSWCGC
jgi:hypothetical protein